VGQKQLLSFARVLSYGSKIIILDEATSSIDPSTEILIQEAIEKLTKGRTCLIVAHRLSTIQNADKIVVLHHGRVAETGTHDALMKQEGIYYRLYRLQFSGDGPTRGVRKTETVNQEPVG
jgi:ATP-binding cassette subfamily B protein